MISQLDFTPLHPESFFPRNGYLKIANHNGPSPLCRKVSWSLLKQPSDTEKILFKTRVGDVEVSPEELKKKCQLTNKEITPIKNETNLHTRSLLLLEIISNQERGHFITQLFTSPLLEHRRKENIEQVLIDIQNSFDAGPIAFESLSKAFEFMLKKYIQDPHDNFFLLSEKLLNKLFLDENKPQLKYWADQRITDIGIYQNVYSDIINVEKVEELKQRMTSLSNSLRTPLPPVSFRFLPLPIPPSPIQTLQDENTDFQSIHFDALISKDTNILLWLEKLMCLDPYKSLNLWKDPEIRPILAKEILEILRYAQENEEFFTRILSPLVDNSLTDCGDRTLYYLNEIIRRMELFKASSEPLEKALPLFKKHFPIALIKQLAKQSLEERVQSLASEEAKSLLRKELLETVFDLLIRFKDPFDISLPFTQRSFANVGEETREEFIRKATSIINFSLKSHDTWILYLAADPEWQHYLCKNSPEIKDQVELLQQELLGKNIEDLEDAKQTISDAEYARRYADIEHNHSAHIIKFFAKETKTLLRKTRSL